MNAPLARADCTRCLFIKARIGFGSCDVIVSKKYHIGVLLQKRCSPCMELHLIAIIGIEANDPNTAILLQHRALMFGVLGVLMLSAIALPLLRVTALTVALFSAASFIVVAMAVGGYNPAIGRVMVADVAASVLLAAGLLAELWPIARRMT